MKNLRLDRDVECRYRLGLTRFVLKKYAEAHANFCKTLENKCRARGMPFFQAPINDPFDELVLKIFRLGGVLR